MKTKQSWGIARMRHNLTNPEAIRKYDHVRPITMDTRITFAAAKRNTYAPIVERIDGQEDQEVKRGDSKKQEVG